MLRVLPVRVVSHYHMIEGILTKSLADTMAVFESLRAGPFLTATLIVFASSVGYFFTRLYHARMLVIDRRNRGLVRKICT